MKLGVAALALVAAWQAAAADARHPGSATAAGGPARVYAVRHWSLGDTTRISVAVSSEFTFQSDRLPNPDRLFFDIAGARPALGGKGVHRIAIGDGIAKQVRVAETQPGTTRIVVDLDGEVEFTASQLSSPERLMIELRRRGPAAPAGISVASAHRVFEPPPPRPPAPTYERETPPPRIAAALDQRLPAALAPDLSRVPGPPRAAPSQAQPALRASTPRSTPRAAALPARTPRSTAEAAPAAAKRGELEQPSLTRVLGLKLGKVVIDPGHGGHDVGTAGPTGLFEKDLVLDVSRRLGLLIERRLGSEVVFTRSDDTFIPLRERTAIANQHRADLFLSIHANSSPAPSASGIETYYLNFTSSKSALDLAARENAGSDRSIYDLKDLVQQIALKDKLEESREFAGKVQTSMMTLARKSNDRSKDRGVRKAPFVVLIGASMPSVLVEIGFLSNPRDEALMNKPEYRQRVAEALFKGVSQYASGLSHFQMAQRKAE